MSGLFDWNASIIFLRVASCTPVVISHHSTVTWAVPPCAGAAVAPPAAAPPAAGAPPPPHAARTDAPNTPAAPCRNLRRLIAGLPEPVPMWFPPLDNLSLPQWPGNIDKRCQSTSCWMLGVAAPRHTLARAPDSSTGL